MPCYHPIEVPKKGFVDLKVTVACGRCMGCRLDKKLNWALRMMDEAQLHKHVRFVTLTYDDEHLPKGGTLVKRHPQLWQKRLRDKRYRDHQALMKELPPSERWAFPGVRFFTGGEYGERTWRPHYHAIVFGADFPDMKPYKKDGDYQLYVSDELNGLWGMGFCTVGHVSHDSCAYVAGYVTKKITGTKAESHYARIDPYSGEVFQLLPEFALMSRNPGIGAGWYDKFKSDVFPSDTKVVKGKPGAVPKFYTDRLKDEDEAAHADLKAKRVANARKRKADYTPERLAAREEVAIARLGLKPRKL